jgi:hypothetical protein
MPPRSERRVTAFADTRAANAERADARQVCLRRDLLPFALCVRECVVREAQCAPSETPMPARVAATNHAALMRDVAARVMPGGGGAASPFTARRVPRQTWRCPLPRAA